MTHDRKDLADRMSETMDQVFYAETAQLKRYIEWTGEELSAELWAKFVNPWLATGFSNTGLSWQAPFSFEQIKKGSFQFGTPYVPKTGLAIVHEGERIIPKNSTVDVGGINIYVSGAGNPKMVAEEINKVLKYRLSGSLAASIKSLR